MADLPQVLYTSRLVLQLNNPDDEEDCQKIIQIHHDPTASLGGNARVGINTVEDIQTKHREHGPTQKYCTKSAPPKGLYHLIFLKDANGEAGELVGLIAMSFRSTMPWPDLGYALFQQFWGKGYGSEAGRASLRWWQEVVGVKEVWTGAMAKNIRSQRCAENTGFVRCGEFDIIFGRPGENETKVSGPAYVLPGMESKWKQFDEHGRRPFVRPTVGVETESQKQDPLNVG